MKWFVRLPVPKKLSLFTGKNFASLTAIYTFTQSIAKITTSNQKH